MFACLAQPMSGIVDVAVDAAHLQNCLPSHERLSAVAEAPIDVAELHEHEDHSERRFRQPRVVRARTGLPVRGVHEARLMYV
jgi:hypothetical protein